MTFSSFKFDDPCLHLIGHLLVQVLYSSNQAAYDAYFGPSFKPYRRLLAFLSPLKDDDSSGEGGKEGGVVTRYCLAASPTPF